MVRYVRYVRYHSPALYCFAIFVMMIETKKQQIFGFAVFL